MKPIAWSFTSLSDFDNCPRQFFHKRVAKDVVDVQGEAALWGDRVHKFFEYRIKRHTNAAMTAEDEVESLQYVLSSEFEPYVPYLDAVYAAAEGAELLAEQQLAIGHDLSPCAWFDKSVWCRGIIDVLMLRGDKAYALDWKTGKRKMNSRQLKLFALLVFLHYPQINTVRTEFVWLASKERDSEPYTRRQIGELWEEFAPSLARYKASFKAEVFPARKSGLCKGWCPVQTCEFWQPKK